MILLTYIIGNFIILKHLCFCVFIILKAQCNVKMRRRPDITFHFLPNVFRAYYCKKYYIKSGRCNFEKIKLKADIQQMVFHAFCSRA